MMANFSSSTGYAWNNIYRLFAVVGSSFAAHGLRPLVSFRRLDELPDSLRGRRGFEFMQLDPYPRSGTGLWHLVAAIRRHRVKCVYLTDQPSADWRYCLFRLAGVRRVLVHNRISVASPQPVTVPEGGLRGVLKFIYCRLPWFGADRTYAVSQFVRDRLVNKARVPSSRVEVILNGIPVDRFGAANPTAMAGPLTIFSSGRATRHKGIHILIEALARLQQKGGIDTPSLRYAGDGPDRAFFEGLARQRGLADRIQFLGELDDVSQEIAAADIVVVPSIWGDACPSAVSEGLASGRPLVATRVGGVPEMIGDDTNAVLVEPGDVEALADALRRLISDPQLRRDLGSRGRARAEAALREEDYHERLVSLMLQDAGLATKGSA